MSSRFEELDYAVTPMGEISLRRRRDPVVGLDVYEVKLGDEFLMSSMFTAAEVELARLGLAAHDGSELDVLVGGLGLGYTAHAALADERVCSLTVVETAQVVIDWHTRQLLPDTADLAADARCSLVHDDFFAMVAEERSARQYDVVLLDIDHTPRHVLHPDHHSFYSQSGLRRLGSALKDDGVFALWSDDPPDAEFETVLDQVFTTRRSHVVTFPNPLTGGTSANTVYVAEDMSRTPDVSGDPRP